MLSLCTSFVVFPFLTFVLESTSETVILKNFKKKKKKRLVPEYKLNKHAGGFWGASYNYH